MSLTHLCWRSKRGREEGNKKNERRKGELHLHKKTLGRECVQERKVATELTRYIAGSYICHFPAELTEDTNPSKRMVVPAKVVYRKGHLSFFRQLTGYYTRKRYPMNVTR